MRQVSSDEMNVWEAAWCSNGQLVALASAGPSENLWYGARLELLDLESCSSVEIYRPRNQLGCLAASSSGTHIAVVEALCSDRGIVAGDLLLIERASGSTRRVDTRRVDVSHVEWRSETRLLVAGLRGIDTVVASYDVATGEFEELWVSGAISATGTNIAVAGIGERDCAFIAEGFVRAPEIGVIEAGVYRTVRSLAAGYARYAASIEAVQRVVWRAQDGVEIEGLLLRPRVRPPYPTVMNIHGGPVWHWRSRWLGRGAAPMLMLLARGYAILLPNPRGSSGRGQEFARAVVGDLGGVDAQDLLAAIDQLTLEGLVDPRRLGVIGGSYGGYLTAWLITQDTRFAAAVPLAPITHHASFYLTSNIPHFLRLFLAGSYDEPGGRYFQRSPIAHAHRVRTPTLSVCGGLDRCTPPTEALQFHCALVEHGVESALLTYSEEGHGIRKFPATIDCAARIVAWFERHMPAASPGGSQA